MQCNGGGRIYFGAGFHLSIHSGSDRSDKVLKNPDLAEAGTKTTSKVQKSLIYIFSNPLEAVSWIRNVLVRVLTRGSILY
jgi:hypothetical protein